MSFYKYVILISLFLIFVAIVVKNIIDNIHSNRYKDECITNSDCKQHFDCVESKDFERKICVPSGKTECKLSPNDDLTSCDPTKSDSCKNCINLPSWGCIIVDYGKLKIVSKGSGYLDSENSSTSTKSGEGSGMIVSFTTKDGAIKEPVNIIQPGIKYKKNDIIQINGGGNNSTVQLLNDPTPYNWKQGDKSLYLPESEEGKGWCLPNIEKQTDLCNKFTSDNILINMGEDKYKWGCYCTTPDMFDHSGDDSLSNCNTEKACGSEQNLGSLWVIRKDQKVCTKDSDCGSDIKQSRCCPPDTGSGSCSDSALPGEKKHCYVKWKTQQDTDPRDGRCECTAEGTTYSGSQSGSNSYIKVCVTDGCAPNGKKQTSCDGDVTAKYCCDCNDGYIRCPEDIVDIELKQRCSSFPQCIKDPCAPLGRWDPNQRTCICDKNSTSVAVPDTNSPVGMTCVDLCNPGPCGDRGNCVVTGKDSNKKAECINCKCPWCNPGDPGCPSGKDPVEKRCLVNSGKTQREGDACDKSKGCCKGSCSYNFVAMTDVCQ